MCSRLYCCLSACYLFDPALRPPDFNLGRGGVLKLGRHRTLYGRSFLAIPGPVPELTDGTDCHWMELRPQPSIKTRLRKSCGNPARRIDGKGYSWVGAALTFPKPKAARGAGTYASGNAASVTSRPGHPGSGQ